MCLKKFIKKYSEFLTIPLAFALWFAFLQIADMFKLSTYDTGIFQKLIFAAIAILVIKGLSWFVLSIDQPVFKNVLDPSNEHKWVFLTEKEKMQYAFWLYVLYFASLVLIVALV